MSSDSSLDGRDPLTKKRRIGEYAPQVAELGDQYDDCLDTCINRDPTVMSDTNEIGLYIKYEGNSPPKITTEVLNYEDYVIPSIMAVWAGLGQIKYPYKVTFASDNFFQFTQAGGEIVGWQLPKASDAFILPLTFPMPDSVEVEEDDDGTVVHVLVVCEPEGDDKTKTRVNIMSDSDHQPAEDVIMTRVRALIDEDRWGKRVVQPSNIHPAWIWKVPKASSGYDAYHVILNAWAYLLDIPIKENIKNQLNTLDRKFYREARHLFNRALRGRLDYDTIALFLRGSGYAYSEEESVPYQCIKEEKYRRRLRRFRAVRMNDTIRKREVSDDLATAEGSKSIKSRHAETTAEPASHLSSAVNTVIDLFESRESSDDILITNVGLRTFRNSSIKSRPSGQLDYEDLPHPELKAAKGYQDEPKATWREEYFHRKKIDLTSNENKLRSVKPYIEGQLQESEVFHPIAALHEALYDDGVCYGFGTPVTFQANKTKDTALEIMAPASAGWKRLLMPFVLMPKSASHELKEATKYRNHWMLATARIQDHATQTVHIDVYDSISEAAQIELGEDFRGRLVEDAMNTVRYSGWPNGADEIKTIGPLGSEVTVLRPRTWDPTFDTTTTIDCPEQHNDKCGHHVILNAWAVILELKIAPEANITTEFYEEARDLFTMACEGWLSSRTIQAFFNVFGYVEEQSLGREDAVYEIKRTGKHDSAEYGEERLQEANRVDIMNWNNARAARDEERKNKAR